ncbi:MAG: metallothionein [Cyanobacteria bacterium P01_A01_bin.135]
MATATQVKCACGDCQCVVDTSTALEKDGQYYCSEACANGHQGGGTCRMSDCGCHN